MSQCHSNSTQSIDKMLWGSLGSIIVLYGFHLAAATAPDRSGWIDRFAQSTFDIVNTVWWGLLLGIFMVSLLARVPREIVMAVLGTRRGVSGIFRASVGGVLLDLCSHGILLVASRLYERGASLGQVMAFLIASPWNSFSLTLILIAMVGLPMTLLFIALSFAIAFLTGLVFDTLVQRGVLPENPASRDLPDDVDLRASIGMLWRSIRITPAGVLKLFREGFGDSAMVLRWILLGLLIASLLRASFSEADFGHWFGPDLAGLALTLLAATVIEVCSEGSAPIGADLVTRANAPGNGFAFLMAGVATDYSEIMVLRETTRSWRIALMLPLITLPQILLLGWLLNFMQ